MVKQIFADDCFDVIRTEGIWIGHLVESHNELRRLLSEDGKIYEAGEEVDLEEFVKKARKHFHLDDSDDEDIYCDTEYEYSDSEDEKNDESTVKSKKEIEQEKAHKLLFQMVMIEGNLFAEAARIMTEKVAKLGPLESLS